MLLDAHTPDLTLAPAFAGGTQTSVLVLSAEIMSLVIATLFILVKLNELLRGKK